VIRVYISGNSGNKEVSTNHMSGMGVDVMITIFCDICLFPEKINLVPKKTMS
jgi:hypothetical protein